MKVFLGEIRAIAISSRIGDKIGQCTKAGVRKFHSEMLNEIT